MSESRVLAIQPASTRGTLMTALLPTLAAAGVACSEARLAGILGHAFTFSMFRGGDETWQLANIEWGFFFRELDLLPVRFASFEAVLHGARPAPTEEELEELKEQTWKKSRRGHRPRHSLDRLGSDDRRAARLLDEALLAERQAVQRLKAASG